MCIEKVNIPLWEYKNGVECINPLISESISEDMVNSRSVKQIDGKILCVDEISTLFMRKYPNVNILFYDNEGEEGYREKRWVNMKYYGKDYYMLTYNEEYGDEYYTSKCTCTFLWNRYCNVVYGLGDKKEDIELYLTEFVEKPRMVELEEWNESMKKREE